jgi:hypothetical protein
LTIDPPSMTNRSTNAPSNSESPNPSTKPGQLHLPPLRGLFSQPG